MAWVVAAFMFALAGQVVAQRFYPGLLRGWEYSAPVADVAGDRGLVALPAIT